MPSCSGTLRQKCFPIAVPISLNAPPKKDDRWSSTLHLPKTKFQIRHDIPTSEAYYQQRTTTELYKWQAAQSDRPAFVLHDGPPYANGSLHVGHALNKVLKDVINRYQVSIGKRVHYVPGWDCHGLPIENKVFGGEEFHGLSPRTAPPDKVRGKARELASDAMQEQLNSFKMYGIMADWSSETTYRTFDKQYVRRQMRIMREMVRRGLIYRAHRPVYWSPSSRSALAEAEIEYDENYVSSSAYVKFPLIAGPTLLKKANDSKKALAGIQEGTNIIIWTTTPWTLPSNMSVNVNPSLTYCIVRAKAGPCDGDYLLIAKDRIPNFEKLKIGLNSTGASGRPVLGDLEILLEFQGTDLIDSTYRHPFLPSNESARPIIAASYVTADSGTGLVHSAPGHGKDDYNVWQEYCQTNPKAAQEAIISPVDDSSCFTKDVRKLIGKSRDNELMGLPVQSEGTRQIIKQLYNSFDLFTEIRYQHRYPIDWRTSQPVIVRCTSQWFANLEAIKEKALAALDNVTFSPASGRGRLEALIRKRNEWCISRQRVWGVPIPVVYNMENDEPLLSIENMEHIENVLMERGIDYWWQGDAEEFVIPSERKGGIKWRKGQDIVDVWFDSGSSWSLLPEAQDSFDKDGNLTIPNAPIADLYLEGTDQHRGWFQSSLLTYIAMADSDSPSAPYKNVVTHGFIIDRKGDKMSKSRGNVLSPQVIIEGEGTRYGEPPYGADVLRFWATRGDPQTDVRISPLIIKKAAEGMRKLRNTCRFILGSIPPAGQGPKLQKEQMDILDRYILNRLLDLDESCRKAYDSFDFAQVVRRANDFCTTDLSSLYMDIVKDRLYSDTLDSTRRQTTVAILDQVLRTIVSILAPIVPHMAEEIHQFYIGEENTDQNESVFKVGWQSVPEEYRDIEAEKECGELLAFRSDLYSVLEKGRQSKVLTTSFGVDVDICTEEDSSFKATLEKYADTLPDLLMVSHVNVHDAISSDTQTEGDLNLQGEHRGVRYSLRSSRGTRCPRCWTYRKEAEEATLCGRCEKAVSGLH
ncbi:isoleucyl-tRNA synthetase [Meira miltonrushii]|uniref:isoleucine--tRNA ligase n=1 Tax=Meira miltonrushii TaxID=1280837 RepID=A0A316VHT3_9BASI|nr:isoleucyl-tRNA synthetase [Meira miltonrushii]PWN35903.1 isoleucyl-tRNA synthetase [Meira miltonrushii]